MKIDEALCRQVRLISESDRVTICDLKDQTQNRLVFLLAKLNENVLQESDIKKINVRLLHEACKLEKLYILESVSDKDFFQVQKNFRSMVRASGVISNWLKGTEVADKMNMWKTEGIELLNGLYDHIKSLESGVDSKVMGKKLDKNMAKQRDRFIKLFTDFSILFRGIMGLSDMFSDEATSVGGYNDIKDIVASLEREELRSMPVGQALGFYDSHTGASMQKNLLGKKKGGMLGRFKNTVAKAISSHSPGFGKIASIDNVVNALLTKSVDQLMAIFNRFNAFVGSDVDEHFLLDVSKNPRSLASMFKSVFDSLSTGHMKTMHM